MSAPPDLFAQIPSAPRGFAYQAELVSAPEERDLARRFEDLPFRRFEFQGHLAHREVIWFGWRYDYARRGLGAADPIPDFLAPLRAQVASFAGQPAEAFEQVLINRYDAGVGIGWHRDKAQFGEVVAVSLLAPCTLRLREKAGTTWRRANLPIEPRSAYLLSGDARWVWAHSIPPVEALRYSVTFRTLAPAAA